MSTPAFKTVAFGVSRSSLSGVGYRLFNSNGTANGARITAGVQNLGSGMYGALVSVPDLFQGWISWDDSVTGLAASEELNPSDYGSSSQLTLQALVDLMEADNIVDTTTNPWEVVFIKKGTGAIGVGTELMRKKIRDVNGVAITNTAVVIGQARQ